MLTATADASFGNRGALWSGVPYLWADPGPTSIHSEDETHLVGGTVVGLHMLPSGSACAVVWGWDYFRPWESGYTNQLPVVKLVIFPPDGRPTDGEWNAARVVRVSETGVGATPLATCSTADGKVAVLIRRGVQSHELCTFDPTGLGTIARRAVAQSALDYGTLGPQAATGSIRIAASNPDIVIVSSNGTNIRLSRSDTQVFDIDLSNNNLLPDLDRVELAGLRFDGGTAVIALTAHLNSPAFGASIGVILRIRADGSRDATFGNNGLWVSPDTLQHRDFVCAGEFAGIVAGCVGRRAVAFAVDGNDQSGRGLNLNFGGLGYVEQDLGGQLSNAVATADGAAFYVFAQRMPPSGDLRTVGCRFNISSQVFGVVEPGFGNAGVVTTWCDDVVFTPAALALSGLQIVLGGTRKLAGEDCERVPVVVTMSAANGDPDPAFGFGGFSLHGSLNHPAYIAPDGSSVFAYRSRTATVPTLRFVLPSGEVGPLVPLTPIPERGTISSITGLADGSTLVTGSRTTAGAGMAAWVVKLTAARTIDTSFGTAGVFQPKTDADQIWALGVRTDGNVALHIHTVGSGSELAIMLPSGQLDTAFGANGFAALRGFTHTIPGGGGSSLSCFLDDDDAVICVAHLSRQPNGPFVIVGLRRISTTGVYDANFGLGAPDPDTPDPDFIATLIAPDGGGSQYNGVSPCGLWRAGGKLYLFATGFAGGGSAAGTSLPGYSLFVAFRWNTNGSLDKTFFSQGWQEGGVSPDKTYWLPRGVLAYSADAAIVYGTAAAVDEEERTVGGTTYTVELLRDPKPALFKFDHPTGLDKSFGNDGAVRYPLWEAVLSSVKGALLSGGRVRVACVDMLKLPNSATPQNNFGGLIQWRLTETGSGSSEAGWSWRWLVSVIVVLAILVALFALFLN